VHDDEVAQALEQIVDSIDPRLRVFRGYQQRLRPPIEKVLAFLDGMIARVPAPVEFSENSWGADPLVRFLFGDVAQMKQVFGTNREIREFFHANPAAAQVFVGLGLTRHEHRIPGAALVGETVQHDVVRTSVGFQDRLVAGASADEAELRRKLKARYLKFIVAEVLRQLARWRAALEQTGPVENLPLWLQSQERERCAFQGLFGSAEALDREISVLRDQVARRGRLVVARTRSAIAPDQLLERTCSVLDALPAAMSLGVVCMFVDHSNIRLESGAGAQVCFAERSVGSLPPRVVVLARFPRDHIVPERDLFAHAQRLLT
jgi:hypothetical protein